MPIRILRGDRKTGYRATNRPMVFKKRIDDHGQEVDCDEWDVPVYFDKADQKRWESLHRYRPTQYNPTRFQRFVRFLSVRKNILKNRLNDLIHGNWNSPV